VKCINGQKLTPSKTLVLDVAHYVPAEKRPTGSVFKNLQAKIIRDGVADEQLAAAFAVRGNITFAVVHRDTNGQSKRHASTHDLAAKLAQATLEQQKQMLGERLYMLIVPTQSQLAGKITVMLLQGLDTAELLGLVDSSVALGYKVKLALDELQKHAKP
jgi:hypothetical protein